MAGERLPGFKIGLLTKVSYYNGNIWGKMLSSVASREPLRNSKATWKYTRAMEETFNRGS